MQMLTKCLLSNSNTFNDLFELSSVCTVLKNCHTSIFGFNTHFQIPQKGKGVIFGVLDLQSKQSARSSIDFTQLNISQFFPRKPLRETTLLT